MTPILSSPQKIRLASDRRRSLLEQLGRAISFPVVAQVDLPEVDPLAWLAGQSFPFRIVWGSREPHTSIVAATGIAASLATQVDTSPSDVVGRCRQVIGHHPTLRIYGGFSFDGRADWPDFGAGRFWLPRFVLQQSVLQVTAVDAADLPRAIADVEQLEWEAAKWEQGRFRELPPPVRREDNPDPRGWNSNVAEALQMIRAEVLEKIVLARQVNVGFATPLDPITLMMRLIDATPGCYHFCFQIAPQHAFLGATPERLFHLSKRQLLSEVVAGTRPRGDTVGQDQRLAYDLLTSEKDQLEHDIVRKSIRQRLHRLVDHLEVDSHASLLKLSRKQHLYSAVEARLKSDVGEGAIIERLHPTPAVGGYPPENALPEIARLESFERGWYAAPVGWISADEAEFAVAIRSGRIHGREMSLYSGAGIVEGSVAEDEWNEIENKISDFLEIIGAAPCAEASDR